MNKIQTSFAAGLFFLWTLLIFLVGATIDFSEAKEMTRAERLLQPLPPNYEKPKGILRVVRFRGCQYLEAMNLDGHSRRYYTYCHLGNCDNKIHKPKRCRL